MPAPSAVFFGRWLDRLGMKHTDQPPFHNTVQPVAIVADHSQLVSPALDAAGVVGGTQAGVVGEESAFLFRSSCPVWIDWRAGSGAAAAIIYVRSGLQGVAPPVLTAPTVCPPQLVSPGHPDPRLVVTRGSIPIGGFTTESPVYRTAAQNYNVMIPRTFVPAGGWVAVISAAGSTLLELIAWFYEMPNENAQ